MGFDTPKSAPAPIVQPQQQLPVLQVPKRDQNPYEKPVSQRFQVSEESEAYLDDDLKPIWDKELEANEYYVRLDKAFDKRISTSSLSEQAAFEAKNIKLAQKINLEKLFKKHRRAIAQQIKENKSLMVDFRSRMVRDKAAEAKKEAEMYVSYIEAILETKIQGDYMTAEEIVELQKVLRYSSEYLRQNPQITELMTKVGKQKALDQKDYQLIISLFPKNKTGKISQTKPDESKPFGIDFDLKGNIQRKKLETPDQSYHPDLESTALASIIPAMRPDQRYKLIEQLMESKERRNQTGEVIDWMASNGFLTMLQTQNLLMLAQQKGKEVMTQEKFDEYMGKTHGDYQENVEALHKKITETAEKIKGNFSINLMERGFGGPAVGLFMGIHSLIWMLTNLLANHGDLKTFFSSPYTFLAGMEGALATEMFSGGLKHGAPYMGIGSGVITRFFESLTEEDRPKNGEEAQALQDLYTIYSNDPEFGSYLENGGVDRIVSIYEEKKRKQEESYGVSIDELKRKEGEGNIDELKAQSNENIKPENRRRRQLLISAQTATTKNKMNEKIAKIIHICEVFKIDNNGKFNAKLQLVKEAQALPKTVTYKHIKLSPEII